MVDKYKTERHDIFNSEYKKKEPFLRKTNIYRISVIIVLIAVFIWGSRDFIYGYITGLEIQDRNHRIITRPYLTASNDSGYFILNRASYNIKLEIACDAKNFYSSYNDAILIPNQILYIWFSGNVKSDTEIIIKGVKVD